MNTRNRSITVAALLAALLLAAPSAFATNRPQCLPSPSGPGSCFVDDQVFGAIVLSSVDDDGDFYRALIPSSPDDFFKFLPTGAVTAHLTDQEVTFTVCPSTAPASCSSDGAGALVGTGRLQLNSFLAAGGVVTCPATTSGSAVITDGVSSYDLTVVLVTRPGLSGCEIILDDIRITALP